MKLSPGATRHGYVTTTNPYTGEPQNADATPVVAVERNGAAAAPAVTVTNVGTGRYRYSYTVDAGWAADDTVTEVITAAVAGLPGATVRQYTVDRTIAGLVPNKNITAEVTEIRAE